MTFFSILSAIFLGPLKLLFEVIFHFANGIVSNPGLAIIFLSLAMNVLVLPLYRRADAMQEQARVAEARLHDGVAHIKKTFSGNERMMMLQTYYRQNDYSPTNALRGSVSLLLEIPFFMAAYQFLSHLELLQGVGFGPIADLGAPDQLLTLFGHSVNLLPILMTGINFVSSAIYLRGFPLKTKIQLYTLALFFLWFLYASPSGLVFYWTLNNLFSLGKNIFYKLKNPKLVLSILTALLGAGAIALYLGAETFGLPGFRRLIVLLAGCVLLLPSLVFGVGPKLGRKAAPAKAAPNAAHFFLAAAFLTVIIGLAIPSTFIAANPEEYVDFMYFYHPAWYVVSAASYAAGTFLLWMGVFYWLAGPRAKVVLEWTFFVFCGIAAVDYLVFGWDHGILTNTLQYESKFVVYPAEIKTNLLLIGVVAAFILLLLKKWPDKVVLLVSALTITMTGLSGYSIFKVIDTMNHTWHDESGTLPNFTLSTESQNVVILVLDRALGEALPYLMQEKPELERAFDGFTYYSNVVSFGGHTNVATPALIGGYEYTPVEMNRRSAEKLVDKHNEALKVMPVLFLQNGFDVTVCDAPLADYHWIPNLSIYDDYPEIHKYISDGFCSDVEGMKQAIENNKRNIFCFALSKVLPSFLQEFAYDSGNYHRASLKTAETPFIQASSSMSEAEGIDRNTMDAYDTLDNLATMTRISGGEQKNFVFLYNDLPHHPMLFQEPEYIPAAHVDNREYDAAHRDRFTIDGKTLKVQSNTQMAHYQTNMAALLRVAAWLDYLRESDAYDNTKIILVSDHGYYLDQIEALCFPDHITSSSRIIDIGNYFPLLMVKDFNAHGFHTCSDFMTNADVPTIAFEGVIADPVNPFTGKPINADEKTAHDQFIISAHDGWDTEVNNGNTFLPCTWVSVTDNIWDRDQWQFLDEPAVLQEHQMP